MIKIIKIRWRHILLFSCAVLGIALIALGWSGIPEKIWGTSNNGHLQGELDTNSDVNNEDNNKNNSLDYEETGSLQAATAGLTGIPGELVTSTSEDDSFFIDYRLDRQQIRGQRLELLREIINNPSSDIQTRNQAQAEVMAIGKNISQEMELENLIRAKGFDDAAVFLEEDNVSVVVFSESLTTEQVARIGDLVARGTGIPEQNIIIIPRN